jgi:hypothetical protein
MSAVEAARQYRPDAASKHDDSVVGLFTSNVTCTDPDGKHIVKTRSTCSVFLGEQARPC